MNWGAKDYRILIKMNNYCIADAHDQTQIEKDWAFIHQTACSHANVTDLQQLSEREEKELSAALISLFLAFHEKTLVSSFFFFF